MAAIFNWKWHCSAKCAGRPQSRKRSTAKQRQVAHCGSRWRRNVKRCRILKGRQKANLLSGIGGNWTVFAAVGSQFHQNVMPPSTPCGSRNLSERDPQSRRKCELLQPSRQTWIGRHRIPDRRWPHNPSLAQGKLRSAYRPFSGTSAGRGRVRWRNCQRAVSPVKRQASSRESFKSICGFPTPQPAAPPLFGCTSGTSLRGSPLRSNDKCDQVTR